MLAVYHLILFPVPEKRDGRAAKFDPQRPRRQFSTRALVTPLTVRANDRTTHNTSLQGLSGREATADDLVEKESALYRYGTWQSI